MDHTTCDHCSTIFRSSKYHPNQRFCCVQCSNAWWGQQGRCVCACKHCHKIYDAKKRDRNQYCSRECAFEAKRAKPKPPKSKHTLVCTWCSDTFIADRLGVKYCSDECRGAWARDRAQEDARKKKMVRPRKCKECGHEFIAVYGDGRRTFCSNKCAKKYGRRVARGTRRARIKGAGRVEAVDPIVIFQRDKWKCHICGCKTPKRMRGTINENAPELDHIVPVSKGGTHTYDNVACCCRKCNQWKSDRTIGQLSLQLPVA